MQSTHSLWDRYQNLSAESNKLRMRDAAERLAVSECELIAAHPGSTRLRAEWAAILGQLATLGQVMALTRNHACVHETTGDYDNLTITGPVGLAINPVIDMRLFLNQWRYGYALEIDTPRGTQRSLQFFDRFGEAVHKVFLTADSKLAAFTALASDFTEPASTLMIEQADRTVSTVSEPDDSNIDRAAFQAEWLNLQDVHEFHPFLHRWGLGRQQAFRLAPAGHAWQVQPQAVEQLLRRATYTQTPIMIFVGNHGAIQIHTGPIQNVKIVGDWLNVLDPVFNLHLRTNLISDAWITRKPSENSGVVTSLELFDEQGRSIMTIFGKRQAGQAERSDWLKLLGELTLLEYADAH
ncbi:hemin-degrading factor [Neisseriaceae bacterium TC5R-5]|nr:hemin-degrading factor [Neisseriaceae bacterium TC5R-5]